MLVVCLFLISCSNAIVFLDNFNDNSLDSSFWNSSGSGELRITETNQQLEITIPSESSGGVFMAGYESKYFLKGDFDIQVDYKLITWPLKNGVRIGLAAKDNTVNYAIERDSWSLRESHITGDHYVTDFVGSIKFVNTTDKTGKLRLVRKEATIYGYYFDSLSNRWVLVSTSPASVNNTTFWIAAWSHDYAFADTTVKMAFDNFIANNGEFIQPAVRTETEQYYPLDISKLVNAGFSPNPLGTDNTDYYWITPGRNTYRYGFDSIPFTIIDPSMNGGEGIIITHGGTSGAPAYFYPDSFEISIPREIQNSVNTVYLLGIAAGWGIPECEPVGTKGSILTFVYDDGTEIIQPMRAGLEYDDWANTHSALYTTFADSGQSRSGLTTHIDILAVRTQGMDGKALTKIVLQDTGTIAAIPIFAITLGTSDVIRPQTVLLISGSNTQSAGYTNIQPSNPLALDIMSYSNGGWSSAQGTDSYEWFNAHQAPFGSGARWVSSATTTESGSGDQWRLFKIDFDIPDGSIIRSAQLWYTADNAAAVYINDAEISSTGFVYGAAPVTPPYLYKNSYFVNFTPRIGSNTLKFVVRNWKHSDYNPTGLLYKSIIEYESPALNDKTGNSNNNSNDFLASPTNIIAILAFLVSIAAIIISFMGFWIRRKSI